MAIAGLSVPPANNDDRRPQCVTGKTDADGNESWSQTFNRAFTDIAYSTQQTTDGGYIIAGDSHSTTFEPDYAYLIKTDSSGNKVWEKLFEDARAKSVQQTTDGGFVVAGQTSSFGAGDNDFWILKLDSSGNIAWQKTYGKPHLPPH